MKHLAVNADDFGYDEEKTLGIAEAFKQNLITNTTVMVNMPYFAEACRIAEQNGFKEKVGLHLNLVEGRPLTERIRKNATFCDESGLFHGFWRRSVKKTSHMTPAEAELLKEELLAQFQLYETAGFTQKHFDTHGHAHTYYAAWKIIKKVLSENGYHYSVRIAKNLFDTGGLHLRNIYKCCINNLIPQEMKATAYFTNVAGFIKTVDRVPQGAAVEIMCHPALVSGTLCNLDDLPLDRIYQSLNRSEWDQLSF